MIVGRVALQVESRVSPDAEPRSRTHGRDERLADLCVHLVGASAAIAGAMALLSIALRRGWEVAAPIAVYAFALILTFAASAAYNLAYDTRLRVLLRRLDHSAIFMMIAGTYTPFTMRLAREPAALWLTSGVWSLAFAGIILKWFRPCWFERVGVGFYLALGWAALAIIPNLRFSLTGGTYALLALGGVLYSVGVCFHLLERLRFHNAIWHGFVLAAAACHFASVLRAVALP
jgi:hemolysin III